MSVLHHKVFGQGKPCIILHGLYGMGDNWVNIARFLSSDFKVYLPDLRNHGQSEHSPIHNYEALTDDVVEFMNQQNLYSAIIIGHSMGGKVAMNLAALHPERVEKLVVVDISPRTYHPEQGDAQLAEHRLILKSLRAIDLDTLASRAQANETLFGLIQNQRITDFLLKNLERSKEGKFSWRLNIEGITANLENVMKGLEDEALQLKYFTKPTLFIKGAKSAYIQQHDIELITQWFINTQIITIADAGHWVHAEQPELFLKALTHFLSQP